MSQISRLLLSSACSLLLAVPVFALSGCADADSDEEQQAHVIPAHRPVHFPAAIKTIEKELPASDSWTDQQREEFRDIIGWLPELAAETDLKKADWDKVNAISIQLLQKIDQSADKFPKEPVESRLGELKVFAATAIELDTFNTYQDFEQDDKPKSEETSDV